MNARKQRVPREGFLAVIPLLFRYFWLKLIYVEYIQRVSNPCNIACSPQRRNFNSARCWGLCAHQYNTLINFQIFSLLDGRFAFGAVYSLTNGDSPRSQLLSSPENTGFIVGLVPTPDSLVFPLKSATILVVMVQDNKVIHVSGIAKDAHCVFDLVVKLIKINILQKLTCQRPQRQSSVPSIHPHRVTITRKNSRISLSPIAYRPCDDSQ